MSTLTLSRGFGAAIVLGILAAMASAQDAPAPAAPAPAPAAPAEAAPASTVEGTVLLVQSYHPEYEWDQEVLEGVKGVLEGTGVTLEVFHMDTKRRDFEDWKQMAGKLAKRRVENVKPDVIIAADDNAQKYFAKDYAGVAGAPQIVFCGVNAKPSTYGYPAANVTGIQERAFVAETMDMVKKLFPDVEKGAIVSDKSTTSDAALRQLKSIESPVKIADMYQARTFDRWQQAIERFDKKMDAIGFMTYHTIRERRDGEMMSPGRVMAWAVDNTTKPTFAFLDFAVRDGALLGVVESGQEQGREAAKIALEILKGKKASDFPIQESTEGSLLINMRTAQKLGVEIPQEILDSATELIR